MPHKPPTCCKKQQGFTLVELSIVLVVIGLIAGGTLTGVTLVKAANNRNIATQYGRIVAAIGNFKEKYNAIPGDMPDAQTYWGVAHATPATCVTTASTTTATCNGNGNGVNEQVTTGSNEIFRMWQHLANAGLIEGKYSGITQGSTGYSATAANAPIGKLQNSLWFTYNWDVNSGASWIFDDDYVNSLLFGTAVVNGSPSLILTPKEQWAVDVKIDDGKPATGVMKAAYVTRANCTTTSSSTNLAADYLMSSNTVACMPIFPKAY